jgi:arginase
VSYLRARCPDCRTFTAVAIEDGYECHVCGRTFAGGLVRVPRAWGRGGEAMADAALIATLPFPDTGTVACDTLEEQTERLGRTLPVRPLVVGGCCCAHLGAIGGLSGRGTRLAVVWLDAHGDLNTIESSPSGNPWATPLREAVDRGWVHAEDVALVGARNLDPPELEFMQANGIDDDVDRAVDGAGAVYVALDTDVLDPDEFDSFMPEPGGPGVAELDRVLANVASRAVVAGMGITAFLPQADSAIMARLATTALGAARV